MKKERDFSYYEFEVGRDGKQPKNDKLVWNVIACDSPDGICVRNIFEYNWVFLRDGLLYSKENYADNFEEFSNNIRLMLQHEYWSRSEYEIVIQEWCATEPQEYKIDVYTQVMLNWEHFIMYVWNNKDLITRENLNLSDGM